MSRPSKRQMPVVGSKQIQTVGIGKAIWIAVRSRQNRHDPRTLLDGLSTKLHVSGRNSSGVLDGRLKAEQFLNRGASDLGMVAQLFEEIQGCEAASEIHSRSGSSLSHDRRSA